MQYLKKISGVFRVWHIVGLVGLLTTATFAMEGQNVGVKRGYTDSRFGQIHFRIVHPGTESSDKPPLLILHLSPNSGQVFSSFLPLVGRDRVAIAPDYPGYGMSDPIEGEQRITDYAAAMLDASESLGLDTPFDLLGYHTGTAVALEMAQQRSDLVRKIILVAVPVLTAEERAAGAALPMIPFDTDGNFAQQEWRRSWKWRGPGQSDASVMATFAEKMRPGVRERGATAILAYDIAPTLKAATHSIMIVRVKDDLWQASKRAQALRPDAEYLELSDYGHGLFHAAPDMMDTITRKFLDAPDGAD